MTDKQPLSTGTINVSRTYKEGGIVSKEEASDDRIDVRQFEGPVASVGHSARMTISLPNYESVQIGVHVTLPCYLEELGPAFDAAKKFVDKKLNQEVKAIRDYKKDL